MVSLHINIMWLTKMCQIKGIKLSDIMSRTKLVWVHNTTSSVGSLAVIIRILSRKQVRTHLSKEETVNLSNSSMKVNNKNINCTTYCQKCKKCNHILDRLDLDSLLNQRLRISRTINKFCRHKFQQFKMYVVCNGKSNILSL